MSTDRTGEGVLLLHELAGSPASVAPVAEALRGLGIVVDTPTLPGHDTVWTDLAEVTWRDWAAACDAALSHVVERTGRPAVVLGVSVGAALALRLAARRPTDVAGVVVVNAALHTTNRLMPLVPVLRHVIRSIPNDAPQVALEGTGHRRYPRLATPAVAQLPPLWRDTRARLRDVLQPVTVVRSASEGPIGLETTRRLRAGLSSREITEVVLERSGHVATIDQEAPLIVNAVVALLRARAEPGRRPT